MMRHSKRRLAASVLAITGLTAVAAAAWRRQLEEEVSQWRGGTADRVYFTLPLPTDEGETAHE